MNSLVVFLAVLAVSAASPIGPVLPATILPKVNIAPAQVDIVKQPYTVQQTELVYRNVPVPVRAVQYTAPVVAPAPVIAAPTHIIGAPAYSAYAAGPAITYAAASPYVVPHAHLI